MVIKLQLRDDQNKHLLCLSVEYSSLLDAKEAMQRALTFLTIKGVLQVESNEIDFKLNGIPVQTNANYEKSKRYDKTGN